MAAVVVNRSERWQSSVARGTDATDTAFPSRVPTATEPTGDGVVGLPVEGQAVPSYAVLLPFGTDAADEIFAMRVTGWSRVSGLWVPVTLAELTCTLGTTTGVASYTPANTRYFADTLAIVTGTAGQGVAITSPADNSIAHAIVDLKGCEKVEVTFDLDTAAGANCLVRWA